MSVWTHIAGIIRVDDIRFTDEIPNFDIIFGKEWTFDDLWNSTPVYDDFETNPETFMPSGSEGSLTKSVWVNPDRSEMGAYTISIFGDLRDYDTPEKIVEWFKERCNEVWVRQAIISVETEGRDPLNYYYNR